MVGSKDIAKFQFSSFLKEPAKNLPYCLTSIRMRDNELLEKIIWGKYTDRGDDVEHAHIWKSATQVYAYVMDRMAKDMELFNWQ